MIYNKFFLQLSFIFYLFYFLSLLVKKKRIFYLFYFLGYLFYILFFFQSTSLYKDFIFQVYNFYDSLLVLSFLFGFFLSLSFFFIKERLFYLSAIFILLILETGLFYYQYQTWIPPAPSLQNSYLFIPHILCYFLAYVLMIFLFLISFIYLIKKKEIFIFSIPIIFFQYKLAKISFLLLTMGLFLGMAWADQIWGSFWFWDPKENWALISWISLLIYFHSYHLKMSEKNLSWIIIISFLFHTFTYLGMDLLPEEVKGMIFHYYL